MTTDPDLSIVVPAYNEAKSIVATLTAMTSYLSERGHSFEIIVVADGNDNTRELAQNFAELSGTAIQLAGSVARRGKGRAIREGVEISRGSIVGFMDADYKTPIEEIDKVLPWLRSGYDIAIGSRTLSESRIEVAQPLYRRLGSKVFGLAMHVMTGLWDIHDSQCGFKFFQAPVARDLFGQQRVDGYMFDVEILCIAKRRGYRIKQVAVRWRDDGDSRLDLATATEDLIDMLRIRFASPPPALPAARETVKLVSRPNESQ